MMPAHHTGAKIPHARPSFRMREGERDVVCMN
jgi:hypothetical protein